MWLRYPFVVTTCVAFMQVGSTQADSQRSTQFPTTRSSLLRTGGRALRKVSGELTATQKAKNMEQIELYRRQTEQYEKDAKEAEAAAEMYASLTRQEATRQLAVHTANITRNLVENASVEAWATAVGRMRALLNDPSPARAVAAAGRARERYDKRIKQYADAEKAYNEAAAAYNLRASRDLKQAHDIAGYAAQERLEGETADADMYDQQAKLLQEQAAKLQGVSVNYAGMALRLQNATELIEGWAQHAADYAAWKANPDGVPGPENITSYTAAPPLEVENETAYPYTAAAPYGAAAASL